MADVEKRGYTVVLGLDTGPTVLEPGDIQQFYFIEDIFSFCMTGKMVFEDRFGFIEYGPLTGNERLLLAYGIEEDRRLIFDIVKYEKVTLSSSTKSDKGYQIAIYFTDITFRGLTKRSYSRSWKNTNHYDILDHILHKWCEGPGENDKILLKRYDYTNTRSDFISPYWTPMECISWLNRKTLPSSSKNVGKEIGGYLYYSNTYWDNYSANKDNNFTVAWKSINNLFGHHVTSKDEWIDWNNPFIFTGGPPGSNIKSWENEGIKDALSQDNSTYVNKILDWNYGGVDSINMKKIQGGQMLGYNFDGKEFVKKTYKYTRKDDSENVDRGMIDDITGLGKKSLFSNISEKDAEIILNGVKTEDELDIMYCNDWLRNYSRQQSLSIIVRGWEGRFAGMMVKDLVWRSFDDENIFNKNLVGSYLIKSITHNFGTKEGYKQRIVLIKNAYQESDNRSLIPINNINIDDSGSIIKGA